MHTTTGLRRRYWKWLTSPLGVLPGRIGEVTTAFPSPVPAGMDAWCRNIASGPMLRRFSLSKRKTAAIGSYPTDQMAISANPSGAAGLASPNSCGTELSLQPETRVSPNARLRTKKWLTGTPSIWFKPFATQREILVTQNHSISINNLMAEMTQPWRPMDLVKVNSAMVRLVRLDGRFNWHQHHEDELFLGCGGNFAIEIEGGKEVPIAPGECYLVPAGVKHRPVARAPAYALLIVEAQTRHDFGVASS